MGNVVLFCYPATSAVDPDPSTHIFGSWIRIQGGQKLLTKNQMRLVTNADPQHCLQPAKTALSSLQLYRATLQLQYNQLTNS
jgi:hypothetical protein